MPEFYTIFARKNTLPEFGGGGQLPPLPVSYAYGQNRKEKKKKQIRINAYSKLPVR